MHALPAHTKGTQPIIKMTVSSGVMPRGSNTMGAALATSAAALATSSAFATNGGSAACRVVTAAAAARKLGTVTRMNQYLRRGVRRAAPGGHATPPGKNHVHGLAN